MNARVQLYDKNTIDDLKWDKQNKAKEIKDFFTPLIKNGVKEYIDNIDTQMYLLKIDDLVLPVTVNEEQYENSYVCSPYSYYVSCGVESLKNVRSRVVKRALSTLLWGFDKLFKIGKLNRVVIVNNWFFSTNLHPKLNAEQVDEIKRHLRELFPTHAILFRSIQSYTGNDFGKALKHNHFKMIASRQVFFLDAQKEDTFKSRIFKSDESLLQKNSYEISRDKELIFNQVDQLTNLYRSVYVSRHSSLNPQMNSKFLKLLLQHQMLELSILKKGSDIDAVVGYYFQDGVMTSPFLGYNVHLPQQLGLYRMTSTMLTNAAREKKAIFHLSSGASNFKKIRKGEANLEYMAVYHQHLPFLRKLPWTILQAIINTIGILYMKCYKG